MSSRFESYLQHIGQCIAIDDEDREPYTKDYDRIRDHILNGMKRTSSVFDHIFGGSSLFGNLLFALMSFN